MNAMPEQSVELLHGAVRIDLEWLTVDDLARLHRALVAEAHRRDAMRRAKPQHDAGEQSMSGG